MLFRSTIFRVGKAPDGQFRFFMSIGKVLDKPKQFCGTSIVVKTKTNSRDVVNRSVLDGWEPHFVVIYGDVKQELEILGRMFGIEVINY